MIKINNYKCIKKVKSILLGFYKLDLYDICNTSGVTNLLSTSVKALRDVAKRVFES